MKKIWNIILLIVLLIFVLWAFSGCKATEPAVVTPQPKVDLAPAKADTMLAVWYQWRYPKLSKADNLVFYNGADIELAGEISKPESYIKDGVLVGNDSIFNVIKTIPRFTPGLIVDDIERDAQGYILSMNILFSRKDVTYKMSYVLEEYAIYLQNEELKKKKGSTLLKPKDPQSFILNAKAKLFYRGQSYSVNAAIVGDSRLFIKSEHNKVVIDVKEKAEGVLPGSNVDAGGSQKEEFKPTFTPK